MTEVLHPVQTSFAPTTAPDELAEDSSLTEMSASRQAVETSPIRPERDDALLDDDLLEGFSALSTRQLRVMVNHAYKVLDTSYPPVGAIERYEMIVEELEHRAQQVIERTSAHPVYQLKEAFRDNPLNHRFELFVDGFLAAYVRYRMIGGQVLLVDGVEQPEFRDQGIDSTLMRHVVLNAHKRRLYLVPQCPMAFSFLADNPQYQRLTAQPEH